MAGTPEQTFRARWAAADAQIAKLVDTDLPEAIRQLLRLVVEQREELFCLERDVATAYRLAAWSAAQSTHAVLRPGLGGELETARNMDTEMAHRRRDVEQRMRREASIRAALLTATKGGRPEDYDEFLRRIAAGEFGHDDFGPAT
jgi:hypothetical protein